MKSKLLVLLLVLGLLASSGLSAFAAVDDTGFSDVAPDAWYAEAVGDVGDIAGNKALQEAFDMGNSI